MVFITEVTKFSKVSLFSGLNNLEDITLDEKYGAICGYTEDELHTVFKDRVTEFDPEEVKMSMTDYILDYLVGDISAKTKNQVLMVEALENGNPNKLNNIFYSFFSSIPYDWYRKNTIVNYEGYYASIFYCYLTAIGLDVTAEDVTNHGRIDLTVKIADKIYIIEFKVVEMIRDDSSALQQIKDKKYYEKYNNESSRIFLIGVEFSRDNRNIAVYEYYLP